MYNRIYNLYYAATDRLFGWQNDIRDFISDYRAAKFRINKKSAIFHLGWFDWGFWYYLFEKRKRREKRLNLRKIICRARGHAGVTFYNTNGLEPDMDCCFCGDDLG